MSDIYLRAFVRIVSRILPSNRRRLIRVVANPLFPAKFWIRNLIKLYNTTNMLNRPRRWRLVLLRRHLTERAVAFETVHVNAGSKGSTDKGGSYCIRCGRCCEFASGLPDFPPNSRVPQRWRQMFSQGIGKGHTFCPFLWQDKASGCAICGIYNERPIACRRFEKEECFYLRELPDDPVPLRLLRFL